MAGLLERRARPTRPWRPTGGRSRCWRAWRVRIRRRGPRWRPAGRGSAGSCGGGKAGRGAGGLQAGAGRPGGAGRRPRGLERRPPRPGKHDQSHRRPAVANRQAGGGGGRVPHGAGDPPEAGRRQPRRHRIPRRWRATTTASASCLGIRASWRRRRPNTARRWRFSRSWPTTTPPSPNSAARGGRPQQSRHPAGKGKPAEAEAEHRKALAIYQKLADDNPAATGFRDSLANSHRELGRLLAREKRFPEAFTALETGLAICQKLVDADPKNTGYAMDLG